MTTDPHMVFLGFGKYARSDKIFALEPIRGEDRGDGRRTEVSGPELREGMAVIIDQKAQ